MGHQESICHVGALAFRPGCAFEIIVYLQRAVMKMVYKTFMTH